MKTIRTYEDLMHVLRVHPLATLYVAVFFQKEFLQWVAVDIDRYLSDYGTVPIQAVPCHIEFDGTDVFMHTNDCVK